MPARSALLTAVLPAVLVAAGGSVVTAVPTAAQPVTDVPPGTMRLWTPSVEVLVGTEFPRVVSYTDRSSGNTLHGRDEPLDTIVLNGRPVRVEADVRLEADFRAAYRITFPELPDVRLHASIMVRDGATEFWIERVVDSDSFRVHTIDIPDHDLVSVRSDDPAPQVAAARIDVDKNGNGDSIYPVTADTPADAEPQGSAYALVSTGKLAAAIETMSVYDNDGAPNTNDNGRLWRQARRNGDVTTVSVWSGQWTYRARGARTDDTEPTPVPLARVVLSGDRNGDSVVDWQDAAIAFRKIMWMPAGAEHTRHRVVPHIPYNIGSTATHPFLRTLDDVKRISLATDGLRQLALLKGYQSEGHDAAHPDYGGHYNQRAGGLRDLRALLKYGRPWNVDFAVHVNATESYPEAHAFSEDLVNVNDPAWAWMDQSYRINQRHDLVSGDVQRRFRQLRDETAGLLDVLYVDVFRETGWTAERLMRELRGQGFQVLSEWSHRLEREQLWSHWANELDYGPDSVRGINSAIIRFLRNDHKDVFVQHPLLMGSRIVEFEGWQAKTDYNAFLANVFRQNLPTKYMQHFPVRRMSEHEIRLSDGVRVTDTAGRRQIFQGDRLVYDGGTYLLPWNPARPEKAYHYNPTGGTTTWQLPPQWSQLPAVHRYELTDQGRKHAGMIRVRGGKVTLDAKAGVPYVLHPGLEPSRPQPAPGWGEGTPLRDPGFNAGDLSRWSVSGDSESASVGRNERGQQEAVIRGGGEVTLAQRVSGLAPGSYSASISVEIEPGQRRDTTVFVTPRDGREESVRLERSAVPNRVAADEKRDTHFQRVRVFFDVPEGHDAVEFGVRADSGDAVVRLDDARIVRMARPAKEGTVSFWDFEDVDQGWGPFVHGGDSRSDSRTHLAELNAPYTQAGWNNKKIDDVLAGRWSLKSFEYAPQLVYRTLPTDVRFEPGHRYRVRFAYESAADGAYGWVLGTDGPDGKPHEELVKPLPARSTPGAEVLEFDASTCGDTWVGLRKLVRDNGVEFSLDNFEVVDLGPTSGAGVPCEAGTAERTDRGRAR
ncbi:hypothetical protein GCM10012275_00610 [Longimycelium tulufanense]|uniref:WW domain-containing protein n=1 Tax=Longimycelium tulufanense TaxID=907463 RepID=A0A8J3C8F8_9PSEU|nr:endo-alpha-N-acetylgalactosaminidase family protein [Longimycelium tulufanense]GGM33063.1 hypothetical protein GCM10012275_00610 [Longimycelium tulufanense]